MSRKSARHFVDIDIENKQSTMALFIKNHKNPEQLFRQVERLYNSGEVQEASHVCQSIVDEYHPLIQNTNFFVLQAKILFEVGDDLGARACTSQALLLESDHDGALEMQELLNAQEDLRDGLYEQGEITLRQLLSEKPMNAYATYLLAHHLLWKNGPEVEALKYFEQSLQLRPRFLRARLGQALAYKKVRDFAKAEAAFAECLRIDSSVENHDFYKRNLQNI